MLELSLGFHMFLGVSSTMEQHLSLTFTTTAKTEEKPYLKEKNWHRTHIVSQLKIRTY